MNQFEHQKWMAQRAKELFSPGTRIELISMNDSQAIPSGTRGTVDFVDDMGTVFPQWDNGRSLGVVYGEDSFRILTEQERKEEQAFLKQQENEGGIDMSL